MQQHNDACWPALSQSHRRIKANRIKRNTSIRLPVLALLRSSASISIQNLITPPPNKTQKAQKDISPFHMPQLRFDGGGGGRTTIISTKKISKGERSKAAVSPLLASAYVFVQPRRSVRRCALRPNEKVPLIYRNSLLHAVEQPRQTDLPQQTNKTK